MLGRKVDRFAIMETTKEDMAWAFWYEDGGTEIVIVKNQDLPDFVKKLNKVLFEENGGGEK